MNVQFTFSSRSLAKLLRTFTPGSPSSAPLPLRPSPSWLPTRPDCESTQIHTFLSHVCCHVSTKVLKPFHAVSDGNAFSLLPTSSLNVHFIYFILFLPIAWTLQGTPNVVQVLNQSSGKKCQIKTK